MKTRKKYSLQLKAQVVALLAVGKSVDGLARDTEIGKDLVYAWRRKAVQFPPTDELRERLADLQLENDILKKWW